MRLPLQTASGFASMAPHDRLTPSTEPVTRRSAIVAGLILLALGVAVAGWLGGSVILATRRLDQALAANDVDAAIVAYAALADWRDAEDRERLGRLGELIVRDGMLEPDFTRVWHDLISETSSRPVIDATLLEIAHDPARDGSDRLAALGVAVRRGTPGARERLIEVADATAPGDVRLDGVARILVACDVEHAVLGTWLADRTSHGVSGWDVGSLLLAARDGSEIDRVLAAAAKSEPYAPWALELLLERSSSRERAWARERVLAELRRMLEQPDDPAQRPHAARILYTHGELERDRAVAIIEEQAGDLDPERRTLFAIGVERAHLVTGDAAAIERLLTIAVNAPGFEARVSAVWIVAIEPTASEAQVTTAREIVRALLDEAGPPDSYEHDYATLNLIGQLLSLLGRVGDPTDLPVLRRHLIAPELGAVAAAAILGVLDR